MLYSDAALGLQATAVLLADGVVCPEHNPTRPGVCYVGVRNSQRLSIDISLNGSCPIVYVDIIIDGVYRRMKYYTRKSAAPNPGPPLTDSIRSVWCRERWGLGWSYLNVASIIDRGSFSSSASTAFSANIGSIEVQFSVPDAHGCERGRTGRSFEDDHVARPLIPCKDSNSDRAPTHRIRISRTEDLAAEIQAEARQSMQIKRPGARPWASFCFIYRDERCFPMPYATPSLTPLTASWKSWRDNALPLRAVPGSSSAHATLPAIPDSAHVFQPQAMLPSNKRLRSPTIDPRKRAKKCIDNWIGITDEEYSSRLTVIGDIPSPNYATTSEQVDHFIMETMRKHMKPLASPTSPPVSKYPLRIKEEVGIEVAVVDDHSSNIEGRKGKEQKKILDKVSGDGGLSKEIKNGESKKLWEGMGKHILSFKKQTEELETRREAVGVRLGFR